MRTILHITADPEGDSFLNRRGERMWRFPWPPGICHYVEVPQPLQAGPAPSTAFWLAYRAGEPVQYGNQPVVLS